VLTTYGQSKELYQKVVDSLTSKNNLNILIMNW